MRNEALEEYLKSGVKILNDEEIKAIKDRGGIPSDEELNAMADTIIAKAIEEDPHFLDYEIEGYDRETADYLIREAIESGDSHILCKDEWHRLFYVPVDEYIRNIRKNTRDSDEQLRR